MAKYLTLTLLCLIIAVTPVLSLYFYFYYHPYRELKEGAYSNSTSVSKAKGIYICEYIPIGKLITENCVWILDSLKIENAYAEKYRYLPSGSRDTLTMAGWASLTIKFKPNPLDSCLFRSNSITAKKSNNSYYDTYDYPYIHKIYEFQELKDTVFVKVCLLKDTVTFILRRDYPEKD